MRERRSVVAAVGRADLERDVARLRERDERIHQRGRRDGAVVHRAGDGTVAQRRIGERLDLERRVGRDERVERVHAGGIGA